MRSTLLAATAIAAALALPLATYAAPTSSTMNPAGNAAGANNAAPNSDNTNSTASTTNPATNNNGTTNNNNTTTRRMARSGSPQGSMIRAHLRQAGFSNIRVRPTAFVASATDRHGRPVLMAFRPNSFQAITLMNGRSRNGSASQNGAETQNGGQSQNGAR